MRFLPLLLLLASCSGLEQSENDKIRRLNAKGEYISRNSDEELYPVAPPQHRVREKYPWETPAAHSQKPKDASR